MNNFSIDEHFEEDVTKVFDSDRTQQYHVII